MNLLWHSCLCRSSMVLLYSTCCFCMERRICQKNTSIAIINPTIEVIIDLVIGLAIDNKIDLVIDIIINYELCAHSSWYLANSLPAIADVDLDALGQETCSQACNRQLGRSHRPCQCAHVTVNRIHQQYSKKQITLILLQLFDDARRNVINQLYPSIPP